jgi:hypothetical protein
MIQHHRIAMEQMVAFGWISSCISKHMNNIMFTIMFTLYSNDIPIPFLLYPCPIPFLLYPYVNPQNHDKLWVSKSPILQYYILPNTPEVNCCVPLCVHKWYVPIITFPLIMQIYNYMYVYMYICMYSVYIYICIVYICNYVYIYIPLIYNPPKKHAEKVFPGW